MLISTFVTMCLQYVCCVFALTHRDRDKMDAIMQTPFSSAFPWMKMFEFRLKFHWSLFLRIQLTIFQHWLRQWLGADQATSHYLNQWWLVYWRIYASLGLNELNILKSLPLRNNFANSLSFITLSPQIAEHSPYFLPCICRTFARIPLQVHKRQ